MVRELAAERALDDGFLESADRGLELLVRDRSLADKLVENLGRDRRQRRLRTLAFRFAVHSHPSCYAPHTKFLTPSLKSATAFTLHAELGTSTKSVQPISMSKSEKSVRRSRDR